MYVERQWQNYEKDVFSFIDDCLRRNAEYYFLYTYCKRTQNAVDLLETACKCTKNGVEWVKESDSAIKNSFLLHLHMSKDKTTEDYYHSEKRLLT